MQPGLRTSRTYYSALDFDRKLLKIMRPILHLLTSDTFETSVKVLRLYTDHMNSGGRPGLEA